MTFDADRSGHASYALDDITLIVGVRLSDDNLWVLDRLGRLRGHYRSLPAVLVIDQGSEPHQAQRVESLCRREGFAYYWEADVQPYCPARAKNLGAARAQTALVFFSDADFFGEPGLFDRLVEAANYFELSEYLDQVINLPIYHLSAAATRSVLDAKHTGPAVAVTLARSVYSAWGEEAQFVAPYSNCFLCRRDFYDLVGGQNERFRRHGSEDFEFLLRVSVFAGQLPLPEQPQENSLGPTQAGFFGPKPYRGFRRLFELMAIQSELFGLRVAHLDHPRPRPGESWFRDYQDKRVAFEREVTPYLRDPAALLRYDFMPRKHDILALAKSAAQADLLTMLRFDGYRLIDEESALQHGLRPTLTATIRADEVASGSQQSEPTRLIFFKGAEHDSFDLVGGHAGRKRVLGTSIRRPGASDSRRYAVHAYGERTFRRVAIERPVSATSYASARLSIGPALSGIDDAEVRLERMRKRIRKLLSSPRAFLQDSRFEGVRVFERWTRRP